MIIPKNTLHRVKEMNWFCCDKMRGDIQLYKITVKDGEQNYFRPTALFINDVNLEYCPHCGAKVVEIEMSKCEQCSDTGRYELNGTKIMCGCQLRSFKTN
jgi:hypothetical protein